MATRKGFSLVELLIVVSTVALLCAVLVPSLSAARNHARLMTCTAQLHSVGAALLAYASESKLRMPPFAFNTSPGDIMLSGHWGGAEARANDEIGRDRGGMRWVNLYALCLPKLMTPASLTCPAANMNDASFFPRTNRYSTYCLRFPYSPDLLTDAPRIAMMCRQSPVSIYLMAAGGQMVPAPLGGADAVPQVRLDRQYLNPATQTIFDPAKGAVVADQFEYQDFSQAGARYAVRRSLCHGTQFNVLMGDGSVKMASDDGTVSAITIPPGGSLVDDGKNYSTYAERIWTFFEAQP